MDARRPDPDCLGDHIDRLYRAARGMCVSREAAERLVHDALARASKRRRFRRSGDDIGYLFRVLRSTFVSDRQSAETATTREGPELYRAVASLPDAFRDALIAVDLMGLSYDEAASALRVREATVATHLHHGRQRVARQLEAEFG